MPEGMQTTTKFYLQDSISYRTLTLTPGVRYDIVKIKEQGSRAKVYQILILHAVHDYSDVTYQWHYTSFGYFMESEPQY